MVQVGYEGGGGSVNVQGEEQKKLDVVTNDVLKRALAFTGKVGVIASEEEDKPVFNADAYKGPRVPGGEGKYKDVTVDIGSKYVTVFDPLDGSSNVRDTISLPRSHSLHDVASHVASGGLWFADNLWPAQSVTGGPLHTRAPGRRKHPDRHHFRRV